ncbi:WAP four-disulfide core domain protein 6B-like [Arvicanthis niloticus]|uniref:WAP four-disulfide core domain protein 6B-like n=1 Tax=Arvicanthis niloticus TaxID=61156 RepID=UPI0014870669|nr:WAP four-disulfide core domain protein 6B-like [Arvicanthis niloticus]
MPPNGRQLPKMRLWGLLPFLVPFIFLWSSQEAELAEGLFIRTCPKNKVKCSFEERDQCSRHKQCPVDQKCCLFACGKKCLDLSEDVCSLPQDPGPCLAYIPRWWHNQDTKLCTQFIYGGCQGNANNFISKDVCTTVCIN